MNAASRNIAIRLATVDDARVVLELVKSAFSDNAGTIDPPSSVERITLHSLTTDLRAHDGFVAVDAEARLVGFVLTRAQADALYWGRLAVASDWRGYGVAGLLMTFVETHAAKAGYDRARIEVRVALQRQQRIYTNRGYVVIGMGTHDGYTSPTYQIMEKPLSAATSKNQTAETL